MKKYYLLFLLIILIGSSISCKKDRETPYEPPKDKYYFTGKVKDISKSFTEDVNGYGLYKAGGCGTNGVEFFATYGTGFKQKSGYYILSNEKIRVCFKNIYRKASWNGDSLFNNYFKPGLSVNWYSLVNVDTTAVNPYTINGVEITWVDGKGDSYSTQWGDQSGSQFIFTEANLLTPGVLMRVKANFNCKVYDKFGNYLVMKDCVLMCPFEEPCY